MSFNFTEWGGFLRKVLGKGSFLVSVCVVFPYLLMLITDRHYFAGGDEAYQLQAALELWNGRGYRSSLYVLPTDLALRQYGHLDSWPPAYSWLILALMKAGFGSLVAATILQVVAVLFSLFVWARIFDEIEDGFLRLAGAALLALHFPLWGNYTTAAIASGLFGWQSLLLLAESRSRSGWRLGVVSALSAVTILFRFQAVSIVPALLLFSIWLDRSRGRSIASALLRSAWLGLLPTLTFFGIYLYNSMQASPGLFLARRPVGLFWSWNWIPDALIAIFLGGTFRMDDPLWGIIGRAGPRFSLIISYLVSGVLIFGCAWIVRRTKEGSKERLVWLGLNLALLLLLFFGLAIFSRYESLNHSRYYHYMVPLILFVGVQAVGSLSLFPFLKKVLLTSTICLCMCGMVLFALHRAALGRDHWAKTDWFLGEIQRLQAQTKAPKTYIVADQQFPSLVASQPWPIFMHVAPLVKMGFCAGERTLLVLASDTRPEKVYFEALDLGLARESLSFREESNGDLKLLWAELKGLPCSGRATY